MVSHNTVILSLGLICFIQPAWLARPYPYSGPDTHAKDPSTVINVYPSLVNLDKSKGFRSSSSGNPCTTDACAAASNVNPKWTANGTKSALKTNKPDESNRDEASSDEIKRKKPKSFREEIGNTYGDNYKPTVKHNSKHDPRYRKHQDGEDMLKKPYTWQSFQDMLQLLKKRKH